MKKIIIACIILILIPIGIYVVAENSKNKDVTFTLNDTGYTVAVFNDSDKKVLDLKASSKERLKEGVYHYQVNGKTFSDASIDFTVTNKDNLVTITPSYSEGYLNDLALDATPEIRSLIQATYPITVGGYLIQKPTLFQKGDWAAGYIVEDVDPRQAPDVYRYIAQKVNGKWAIIVKPQLTINARDYPKVPVTIITYINDAR